MKAKGELFFKQLWVFLLTVTSILIFNYNFSKDNKINTCNMYSHNLRVDKIQL